MRSSTSSSKAQIFAIILFMSVLILPTVIWTGMGVLGMREEVSSVDELGENRVLAELPAEIDLATLTADLENYYNDRVPFRSEIILRYRKANSQMEYFYQNKIQPVLVEIVGGETSMENITVTSDLDVDNMYGQPVGLDKEESTQNETEDGRTPEELEAAGVHVYQVKETVEPSFTSYGYKLKECANCGKQIKTDIVEKLIDETYLPPKEGEGRVIQGRSNWLYYAGDNSIAYYCGTNILSREEMDEWMSLMQELQNECDKRGIQLGFMIMPNKEQVYPEYMPSYTVKTPVKREETFVNYVRKHSDMKIIYPAEELRSWKKYFEMYFPYDTHWTQAGAFVGTMAMYKEMGLETTNLLDLKVLPTKFTQKGLIDTGSLDETLYTDDTDYVIFYKPETHVTWFEGEKSFIMPSMVYRSTSDAPNNQKLIMIGDSFRLAMIPYFSQDYSEICVAHRNYVDDIKADLNGDFDVLILGTVERFDKYLFEAMPTIIDYVKGL